MIPDMAAFELAGIETNDVRDIAGGILSRGAMGTSISVGCFVLRHALVPKPDHGCRPGDMQCL